MKTKRTVLLIILLLAVAGLVSLPVIVKATSSPEFCNSCHVMNSQYEHWRLTGLHRSIKCVDCHLPNNNIVNHLVWKAIDGTKDVVLFYTGLFDPSNIEARPHTIRTVQKNCNRCHADMVSLMNNENRNCWSCHRRSNHTYPEISRLEMRP
jgi:cytochrome c nitrite reductase small subunit